MILAVGEGVLIYGIPPVPRDRGQPDIISHSSE
jgi:hypothetical protein